jgi:GIY-YIG catalytic domain/NUMOD1 domain
MKKDSNNYIIYKAENMENGCVYIGTTTKSIVDRKKDHEQKANTDHGYEFQEAISTYGAGAFSWAQVDTASSADELAQKEKQYILNYNSKEEGYNADSGGGFKKTVYQYSLADGSLVNSFNTLESAGKSVNATKKHISRACLNVNQTYGGFRWSYEYQKTFKANKDKRLKSVQQLDLNNVLINKYFSIVEASWATGIHKSSIAKTCRGENKTAGGFLWQYT